ncbi:MAG: hypothetical protein K9H16_09270 [Bacteroidales bacterium]|nr:hypothetical protein [Bacteroidales bacterium]
MDFSRLTDLISKNLFWLLLISVFFFIYFVPIYVPSNIAISGKVYPAKKWILFAGTNGQMMNTQIDLVAGVSNVYESREFSRGDDVRFEIKPEILKQSIIEKGDTIGIIFSNETNMLLNAAKKQLEVQNALLKTYISGDKKEVIALAEKQLEYARIDATSQWLTYNRQKDLFDQKVITAQEIENEKRIAELKQVEVGIKEAELQALISGEKPESIELIKAEIAKIESEINDLEGKREMQTIISPITGIFRNSFASDTLMVIESMDELIIKMPVGLKDRSRIFNGQRAECTVYGQNLAFDSEVVHISNHINVTGGKQTFIVTAIVGSEGTILLPGVVFKGKLAGNKILLRDYVAKWFRFFKS